MGKARYFLAGISAAIIWGFFAIPLRKLISYPSELILDYRILTSLIVTWTIVILFRGEKLKSDIGYYKDLPAKEKRGLILLTLTSAALITGNWYSYIYAINHISIKSAAFAYMVCPLITALGGFLILKEKLSSTQFIAIGIAVISVAMLGRTSATDTFWAVFIASFYAFYLIIQRKLNTIDKFNMLGIQLIIAAVLMLPLFIYNAKALPSEPVFWSNIVLISVVFTILPLFLSLYSLIGLPSSTTGMLIYINPIVAFAVAFVFFKEEITLNQLIGYLILAVAVIIFNWPQVKGIFIRKVAE